jgi:hypothetical protein
MNTTDRILNLCKLEDCCPLGLAGRHLPERPWWLEDTGAHGWAETSDPRGKDAAEWLAKDEEDCATVIRFWDGLASSEGTLKSKRKAIRRALALGIFSHPARVLTRCEQRWLENPLRYGEP